jgi:hypothetical protein
VGIGMFVGGSIATICELVSYILDPSLVNLIMTKFKI